MPSDSNTERPVPLVDFDPRDPETDCMCDACTDALVVALNAALVEEMIDSALG